jgi:uncharacterized RDD family membrane protein YckC
MVQCPQCGARQEGKSLCGECGAVLPVESDAVNPYAPPSAESSIPTVQKQTTFWSDYGLAGRGERLLAQIVDGLVNVAAAVPGFIAIFVMENSGIDEDQAMIVFAVVLLVPILAINIYQWVLLSRDGQTIGKKVLGIRIVNYVGGENPGFGRAVGLRLWVNGILGSLPTVGAFYGLIDILFIFSADRRCIHDLIAGTKVISFRAIDVASRYGTTSQAADAADIGRTLEQLDTRKDEIGPF